MSEIQPTPPYESIASFSNEDALASENLRLVYQAFEYKVKAKELEHKMVQQVMDYGEKTFNPYFIVGQFASMAVAVGVNRIREARAVRLHMKADRLLTRSQFTQYRKPTP